MKVAMVSLITEDFFIAYEGFIISLLEHNAWLLKEKMPFVMIDMGITDVIKKRMLEYYPYIEFRSPLYENYKNVNFSKTHSTLKATYYKLDILSLYEYDRVVFLDLDMTVIRDIHELFTIDAPFAAAHGYNLRNDSLRHDINSGVLVINKQYLNEETYKGVIKIAEQGLSMPDQKSLYGYFFRKGISELPKKFNCEKRMVNSKTYKQLWEKECCIVHWISEKPWQEKTQPLNKGYEELEKLWWSYYVKRKK